MVRKMEIILSQSHLKKDRMKTNSIVMKYGDKILDISIWFKYFTQWGTIMKRKRKFENLFFQSSAYLVITINKRIKSHFYSVLISCITMLFGTSLLSAFIFGYIFNHKNIGGTLS